MPLPFIVWAAGAAAVHGVAKGIKATSNNSEAKSIIEDAQYEYDKAKNKFENQRLKTTNSLNVLGEIKLNAWSKEIKVFLSLFNSFKNVKIEENINLNEKLKLQIQNPDSIKNMQIASVKAEEIVQGGIASLGAGALAGIASYGGAMMFASASTGTAIASLSGVAATNATLAWFGGGSLAAGGFGIAGGTLALGGIVVGPVLAVAGSIMAAKSEENLAKARRVRSEANNAIVKMDAMKDFLYNVEDLSNDYSNFICEFNNEFDAVLQDLTTIKENHTQYKSSFMSKFMPKIDFNTLSNEEQQLLQISWLLAQILYSVLSAPLLTEDGQLEQNAKQTLIDASDSLLQL